MLEKAFPEAWFGRQNIIAFLLGWVYALIGIILARIIFPRDPAIAAVAFTSILIIPSINMIISYKLDQERFRNLSILQLLRDNGAFTKSYVALFLGMLLVYSSAAIVLPSLQTNALFRAQLDIRNISGEASLFGTDILFDNDLFMGIFMNNLVVIMVTFAVSLFIGGAGVFLITWNASVWGTIFGITARNAGFAGANPLTDAAIYFIIILLIVMPHMMLEVVAYIESVIAGGTISTAVIKKNVEQHMLFSNIVMRSIILLVVGIIILAIGAAVETIVLENVTLYQDIIARSRAVPL